MRSDFAMVDNAPPLTLHINSQIWLKSIKVEFPLFNNSSDCKAPESWKVKARMVVRVPINIDDNEALRITLLGLYCTNPKMQEID